MQTKFTGICRCFLGSSFIGHSSLIFRFKSNQKLPNLTLYFSRILLSHFRNYSELDFSPGSGVNTFSGPNGSGKTSLLEAVHFLALTRGFMPQGDKYALQQGEHYFMVEGELNTGESFKVSYLEGKGKKIFQDQIPLISLAEHIGKIPVVSVLPADTDLIREGGQTRRRFLDALISQYDPAYLSALIKYEKALKLRNAALLSFLKSNRRDEEQLQVYESVLIPNGIQIHAARKSFLDSFIPVFKNMYGILSGGKENPDLELESPFALNDREEWERLFFQFREKDAVSARTHAGTHREDLSFLLNGTQVKLFGSQGQQKTFVLALKLANFNFLKAQKQTSPLLLLDDIFDKLDADRVKAISLFLVGHPDTQVWITDTHANRLSEALSISGVTTLHQYSVFQGKVTSLSA
ncbi:MAG: DNA replication and repair protein RecF [Sphingobacteriia bacterium]|nr:DNA replication and repair protein RecF [Sphingobacteriia bacterium]